jgi:ubiquitin-hydrolase Zn-finger-containing protein
LSDLTCGHLTAIKAVLPARAYECEECVKIGAQWVHLRTCQTCGTTRCCDQSPNRHARKHAKGTSHHVVASAEPDERWLYCFEDDAFLDY